MYSNSDLYIRYCYWFHHFCWYPVFRHCYGFHTCFYLISNLQYRLVINFIPVCTWSPIFRSDIVTDFPFWSFTLANDGKQPPPDSGNKQPVVQSSLSTLHNLFTDKNYSNAWAKKSLFINYQYVLVLNVSNDELLVTYRAT